MLGFQPNLHSILFKESFGKITKLFILNGTRGGISLAHSHLTGLQSVFSQALLVSKKAPSPSARSRSNFDRSSTREFSPLYSTISNKKNKSDKRTLSFVNGGNDEARTRDLMRDRHAL